MSVVFVSGLPQDTEEKELRKLFSKHGRITEVDLKNEKSHSCAWISYANPLDADVAIRYRNGDIFNGKMLECTAGKVRRKISPSESSQKKPAHAVTISHLPKGCTVTDLKLFLYKAGPTTRVGITKDGNGVAEFASNAERNHAIKTLNSCLLKTSQQTSYVSIEEANSGADWDIVTEFKPIRKKTVTLSVSDDETVSSDDEQLYRRRKNATRTENKSDGAKKRIESKIPDEDFDEAVDDLFDEPPARRTRSTANKPTATTPPVNPHTRSERQSVQDVIGVVPMRLDLSQSNRNTKRTKLSPFAAGFLEGEKEGNNERKDTTPTSASNTTAYVHATVSSASAPAQPAEPPPPSQLSVSALQQQQIDPRDEMKKKYKLWGAPTGATVTPFFQPYDSGSHHTHYNSPISSGISQSSPPPCSVVPPPPPPLSHAATNVGTQSIGISAIYSSAGVQVSGRGQSPPAVAASVTTARDIQQPYHHHSTVVTACAEAAASTAGSTESVHAPLRTDSHIPLRPLKPQLRRCPVSSHMQFTAVLQEPLSFKITVTNSHYAVAHPHILSQGEAEYGNAVDDWLDHRLLTAHGSRHSVSVADSHWLTLIKELLVGAEIHLNEYDPVGRVKASPDYTVMYRGMMVLQGEVFESAQDLRSNSSNFIDRYHAAVAKVLPKGRLCIPGISTSHDLIVLYALGCKDGVFAQHIIRHYKVGELGARLRFVEDVMKILRWMTTQLEPEEGFHLLPCVRHRVGPGKYVTLTREGVMREYNEVRFSPLSIINVIYSQRLSNVEWGTVTPTAIVVMRVGARLVDVLHKRRLDKNAVLNQVMLAVKQLHWLGYAHCNICVKNIFVEDELYGGNIFLGDLEFCCMKTSPPPSNVKISDVRAATAEELDNYQLNRFQEELSKL